MSLATYGDLQAAVLDWATKSSLKTQVVDFIALAHEKICSKLRAPVLYARAAVTINGETVAAPTGFLASKRFYVDVTPRRVLHLTDSAHLIDLTLNAIPSAYPTHFAVEGTDTLAFAPLFSGSCVGQMLYYQAPATLVNAADTNVVLAKYPSLYLHGALEALFRYLEDDNNADRYQAQFLQRISDINDDEAKDAMRGPLAGSAATGVVV